MARPSEGKLLYHITHVKNILSIFEHGLLSRQDLRKLDQEFEDIADQEILSKREIYFSYVLFHFYAKNPFDCAVCRKYGSEKMAIITIPRELHKIHDFLIIPSHPLDRDTPKIYSYDEGFKRINWDILNMDSGRDYYNSEIRKACMAECLVESPVTVDMFKYIYVYNDDIKQKLMKDSRKMLEDVKMEDSEKILDYFDSIIQVAPYMFP